ncbi:hypothetical protein TPHA_0H02960 [Tetrapisispora phaffii CBS 4417]|uniref:BolA protein n=1 Tax=Tetrapisispora phaffii (strain ATCC 24235 / CBS 4417 / NBRC 1672 / NRRL Y-8282 / UCD 70-5) TaxID=1071381 RepID=G8BWP8_TETPH|nr:hypothetical protein TPHA_0H02960 [Tetrapisispora phaffii CBS 4417]CCE64499.1 hypothetical protein TPHA_0H02960 [Tetrapisispora phaffii CBS 4417]
MLRRTIMSSNLNKSGIVDVPRNRSITGPIANEIKSKIYEGINGIDIFEIANESYKHAGHYQVKISGTNEYESHFKLMIISNEFDGMTLMKRHRRVFTILKDTIDKIHSIQIDARTVPEHRKLQAKST